MAATPAATPLAKSQQGVAETGSDASPHPLQRRRGRWTRPYAGGSSFMERVSEAVASGMGTVGFLIVQLGRDRGVGALQPRGSTSSATRGPGCSTARALTRSVHPAEPRLLCRGLLHGRACDHRPEGADENRQGERGSRSQASRRALAVPDRSAPAKHRPHRADPHAQRAAQHPHTGGPRGDLPARRVTRLSGAAMRTLLPAQRAAPRACAGPAPGAGDDRVRGHVLGHDRVGADDALSPTRTPRRMHAP